MGVLFKKEAPPFSITEFSVAPPPDAISPPTTQFPLGGDTGRVFLRQLVSPLLGRYTFTRIPPRTPFPPFPESFSNSLVCIKAVGRFRPGGCCSQAALFFSRGRHRNPPPGWKSPRALRGIHTCLVQISLSPSSIAPASQPRGPLAGVSVASPIRANQSP